jgi:hypothetical protein
MAQHDLATRLSRWRLAAFFWLMIAAAVAGRPAFGMVHVEVYQTTVPLADRSTAAQGAAFEAALRIVLVRATGSRTAAEDPAFTPLLSNARRYVQQYRSTSDDQLWVAFDGTAIERWLTQNGQALWGRDRPSTFVWLSVQGNGQPPTLLSADDTSELKTAIDTAALLRGVPLIWPDAATAAAASGAVAGGANPADLGHRQGAEGLLVGRANGNTAAAAVHWTLQFQDRSSEFTGALEGVNHAADMYAGIYAASGSLAPVEIQVTGIQDVKQYAAVQNYLASLSFVAQVGVVALTADTFEFRLMTRGGIEALQHAIALNGRLQPLPQGENGIARFQLQP